MSCLLPTLKGGLTMQFSLTITEPFWLPNHNLLFMITFSSFLPSHLGWEMYLWLPDQQNACMSHYETACQTVLSFRSDKLVEVPVLIRYFYYYDISLCFLTETFQDTILDFENLEWIFFSLFTHIFYRKQQLDIIIGRWIARNNSTNSCTVSEPWAAIERLQQWSL